MMEIAETDMSQALQWAAQSFAVDRVTAEVADALASVSVEAILLKGPTIATWLYAEEGPRLYADTDLLIRHRDWEGAENVLRERGFLNSSPLALHPRMSTAATTWGRRSDEAEVDLHSTLFGLEAPPETVWAALREDAREEVVGGTRVLTLSHPARLLHIALHAVQHSGEDEEAPMVTLERRPMKDLERAIATVPQETWQQARELAARLQGQAAFAAGLCLLPAGRRLAQDLGVETEASVEMTLRLENVPMSEGFAELAAVTGIAAKLRLLARELFPNVAFMRWWRPLARRGRLGLALAYAWRLVWLATHAVPGYVAWRRARRQTGEQPKRHDP
jgi:Uncharacterised nucleotidyltransferase